MVHRVAIFLAIATGLHGESPAFGVPPPITTCVEALGHRYEIKGDINPYYVRGDFDGDGVLDHFVAVQTQPGDIQGALFCPGGGLRKTIVLGARNAFHGMENLSFGAWRVHPKGKIERGVGEGPPPVLRSDALLVIWPESASAIIYWDGKNFRWYQQGD